MDPVVRITCYLVLVAQLSAGNWWSLLLVMLLLAPVALLVRDVNGLAILRMMWRLKWLCLSLLVVYGWLTPGSLLWDGALSPSREGVLLGLYRLSYLLVLVFAAQVIMLSLKREQLVAALYQLLTPLAWSESLRQRLVIRLFLVFDFVRTIDSSIMKPRLPAGSGRIRRIVAAMTEIYQLGLDRAEKDEPLPVSFERPLRPPFYQWLWPIMLVLLLWQAGTGFRLLAAG
jgi:energy-coupling factor transport system permease protein